MEPCGRWFPAGKLSTLKNCIFKYSQTQRFGLLVTLMGSLALMTALTGKLSSTHAGAKLIDFLFPNNNFPHGLLCHWNYIQSILLCNSLELKLDLFRGWFNQFFSPWGLFWWSWSRSRGSELPPARWRKIPAAGRRPIMVWIIKIRTVQWKWELHKL